MVTNASGSIPFASNNRIAESTAIINAFPFAFLLYLCFDPKKVLLPLQLPVLFPYLYNLKMPVLTGLNEIPLK